jgi:hypothetical protein|nr:MAG TPA: hypothetical protein [Caudoviricetes sp.]
MRGYRVKRKGGAYRVQVRFLFFWRTLAIYPFSFRNSPSMVFARKEAVAIASELIKRSN